MSRIGSVLKPSLLALAAMHLPQICLGVLSVAWLTVTLATLGAGPSVQLALVGVIFSALFVAALVATRLASSRTQSTCLIGLSIAGLWTLFIPSVGRLAIRYFAAPELPSSTTQLLCHLTAATLMLWLPMMLLGLFVVAAWTKTEDEANSQSLKAALVSVLGLPAGMSINALWLSAQMGQDSLSLVATGGLALAAVIKWIPRGVEFGLSQAQSSGNSHACGLRLNEAFANRSAPLLIGFISGMAFVALGRLFDQLSLNSLWSANARAALFLLGVGLGRVLNYRWPEALRSASVALVAVVVTLALAAFPSGVEWCLDWNSTIESASWNVAGRCLMMAAFFVPLGLMIGSQIMGRHMDFQSVRSDVVDSSGTGWKPMLRLSTLIGFTGGFVFALTYGLFAIGVAGLLVLVAVGCVGLTVADWMSREGQRDTRLEPVPQTAVTSPSLTLRVSHATARFKAGNRQASALVVALLCVTAIPFATRRYRPEWSAKLLFDTRVFAAHRVEPRTELLPHLDEARCLAVDETWNGTLSQWRVRGAQLQFRQSGVLTATQSTQPTTCPQPISEALQVILPLILHEKPAHVAVLGLRSGLAVETALQFPVQSVLCTEPDAKLLEVVDRDIWSRAATNPKQDDRLQVVTLEPTLLLPSQPQAFDLIISNTDHAALLREAASSTTEFLQAASQALAPDGLFCQRFPVADFGLRSVNDVLATWHSVFAEVAVVETSPGEWLLIGANEVIETTGELSHQPIVADEPRSRCFREGLIERLQRPHVRQALADMGWDWASPLLLNTMVFKNTEANATGKANRATSCQLAGWLPWDVMRWSHKLGEINAAYATTTAPLNARLGVAGQHEEVKRRLAELKMRNEISLTHSDQYWAYRKVVKKRLIESPHEQIVQVKGQRPTKDMHPTEQRRMQYFETLGMAAKMQSPSANELQVVAAFQTPFDPLISPFVGAEVAELASKNRSEHASLEWQLRLRALNHALPGEQSVRDVVTAIELLCRHPEVMPDAAARGDQLDALLQQLHDRWYARGDISSISSTASDVMLNDIEHSVAAIELAYATMDETRVARGLSESESAARRVAFEKSLMNPLRRYRSLLMKARASNRDR